MRNEFDYELSYTEKLKNDSTLFEKEYGKLKQSYSFKEDEKIHEFIHKNPGLLILLDKFQPDLENLFPNGKFELEIDEDPEIDCTTLIVRISVGKKLFNNGMMQKIDKINFKQVSLMQEMRLMSKMLLIPDILKKELN